VPLVQRLCLILPIVAFVGCVSDPAPGGQPGHSAVTPVTQNRDSRSYDWQTRHEAILAYLATHEVDLVLVGDSIFHNLGGPPAEPTRPAVGQETWDTRYAPRRAANLGFGWDRTENVLWRLQHGELDNAAPRAAVVLIGTNNLQVNSARQIAEGITAVCDTIHARAPETRILLLAILPRKDASGTPLEGVRLEVNRRISDLAARDYLTFRNLDALFRDANGAFSFEMLSDGIHPTAEGYRRIATAIEPDLQRLMENSPGATP